MEDHSKGCEQRNHSCTCGYDDERDAEIKRLRSELSDALATKPDKAAFERAVQDLWSAAFFPEGASE